ncbi:MAG: hypothetical protein J6M65_09715 [Eubacterium sp.]|nr:hypothetical protein [Eubacterium sp.]
MKIKKWMILIIAVMVLFLTGCTDADHNQTFESPFGDDAVIVEVDYLSRPNVLYKGKRIFEYDGAGFNETVYWDIEWISEDKIRLYVPGDRCKRLLRLGGK